MKRSRLLFAVALFFIVVVAGAFAARARRAGLMSASPGATDSATHAPTGVRVRVEVINTTRTRGLARRATRVLRDHGFDVVSMTTGGPAVDSTLVLDRSGHREWALAIARVLGPASRTEVRPDSSHYLDVTVLLGTSWRPPAKPLYP